MDTTTREEAEAVSWPNQDEVADWLTDRSPASDLAPELQALELAAITDHLIAALIRRSTSHPQGFHVQTQEVRVALADTLLKLMRVSDSVGIDLATAATLRWAQLQEIARATGVSRG